MFSLIFHNLNFVDPLRNRHPPLSHLSEKEFHRHLRLRLSFFINFHLLIFISCFYLHFIIKKEHEKVYVARDGREGKTKRFGLENECSLMIIKIEENFTQIGLIGLIIRYRSRFIRFSLTLFVVLLVWSFDGRLLMFMRHVAGLKTSDGAENQYSSTCDAAGSNINARQTSL